MVTTGEYGGVRECTFDFVWKSKFACPPCRVEQVDWVEALCGAEGYAGVSAVPKAGEHCVTGNTPDSYLKHDPDYNENWWAGVYMRGGKKYVSKHYFLKWCNIG